MSSKLPSLVTPDRHSGLLLAAQLAESLHLQFNPARVTSPGGTTYGASVGASREQTASILFFAIAAANDGWSQGPAL